MLTGEIREMLSRQSMRISFWIFSAAIALFLVHVAEAAAIEEVDPANCVIVAAPGSERCARELSNYVFQMTGSVIETGAPGETIDSDSAFLLGKSRAQDKLKFDWQTLGNDGFIIKSIRDGGKNCLIIAGNTDQATNYGVSEYLERHCEVGFFVDGYYIPRRKTIPFMGIDQVDVPRFTIRFWNSDTGHWGLKKYQSRFRTAEEWLRQFDWLEKRRLNFTLLPLGANSDMCSGPILRAFDVGEPPLEARYLGGWPAGWAWPVEYRDYVTNAIFQFGRERGIKFWSGAGLGDVPARFRSAHPELKYMPSDGYDNPLLHPDEPATRHYTKVYNDEINKEFGADHIHSLGMYAEANWGQSLEQQFEIKMKGTRKALEYILEIDPDAVFYVDGWDTVANGKLWTPERMAAFLKSLPKDKVYVYNDNSFDQRDCLYKLYNCYEGIPWGIGVLTAYAGDDELHGNIPYLIERVREAAGDAKCGSLIGFFMYPELTNCHVMFWHLMTKLAWNPKEITVESYLDDFCLHRYGRESQRTMAEASKWIVRGCYSQSYFGDQGKIPQGKTAPYKAGGSGILNSNTALYKFKRECAQRFVSSDKDIGGNATVQDAIDYYLDCAELMRKGIDVALGEKDRLKDNPLYVNDLFYYTKQYITFLYNYHYLSLSKAYWAEDRAGFDAAAADALKCLEIIEKMLSTRPDHSLKLMIDEVMSVPGTNPFTPEMVKKSCVNWDYTKNDVYEQVKFNYRPLVEMSINVLRRKMQDGSDKKDLSECANEKSRIDEEWLRNPLRVDPEEKFKGSPLESVLWALSESRGRTPRRGSM
ncbi:MAG: alpha-N-acetylglucosaminidase C-terminal domain-containing protein [Armatimonadetes bacterium]|nr:alpha-N-acetylglucosaminidase C-terminal domain-containing protein [Armatimonadota bacterium]